MANSVIKLLKRLRRDDRGATAIEYGLIAALVAVGLIGTLQILGNTLDTFFQNVVNELNTATQEEGDQQQQDQQPG
ncbi:Flp family type IVb pilin [Eilatimonas milleporae]|uniref:Pilus assembly protein Flp/PilA n=1 Tax=Eilatimonas milleporae TaxID=911205 RepID=A0A3M0D882_9PROT|nr:Flp family type IVb pilin [Eilatimonas milleporae]RMB12493.1 pilus assembly protein Flp/PilA [Eilatimonas milleporae]